MEEKDQDQKKDWIKTEKQVIYLVDKASTFRGRILLSSEICIPLIVRILLIAKSYAVTSEEKDKKEQKTCFYMYS